MIRLHELSQALTNATSQEQLQPIKTDLVKLHGEFRFRGSVVSVSRKYDCSHLRQKVAPAQPLPNKRNNHSVECVPKSCWLKCLSETAQPQVLQGLQKTKLSESDPGIRVCCALASPSLRVDRTYKHTLSIPFPFPLTLAHLPNSSKSATHQGVCLTSLPNPPPTGEMVLLLHWSFLNYAAVTKILKKHDKRTGRQLKDQYLAHALQQVRAEYVLHHGMECEMGSMKVESGFECMRYFTHRRDSPRHFIFRRWLASRHTLGSMYGTCQSI